MKETSMLKQFWKASLVEVSLLVLLAAFKAEAQTPVLRTLRPTEAARLPGRWDRRPVVEIGGGMEYVVDQGPRALLRVTYQGIDANGDPYIRESFLVASAEIGIGSDGVGGEMLSRAEIRFTPFEYGFNAEQPHGWDVSLRLAPSRFTRETSIGVQENLTIQLAGMSINTTGGAAGNAYAIVNFATQLMGYTFMRTARGAETVSAHSASALYLRFALGFGIALTEQWSIEWRIVDGEGDAIAGDLSGVITQLRSEIRVRFAEEPGLTRFSAFASVNRRDSFLAPVSLPFAHLEAWSVLAGIEFGF